MKTATIKHFHERYWRRGQLKTAKRESQLREVVKLAAKEGYAFHDDGRAYIPEANRGVGVGYRKREA